MRKPIIDMVGERPLPPSNPGFADRQSTLLREAGLHPENLVSRAGVPQEVVED